MNSYTIPDTHYPINRAFGGYLGHPQCPTNSWRGSGIYPQYVPTKKQIWVIPNTYSAHTMDWVPTRPLLFLVLDWGLLEAQRPQMYWPNPTLMWSCLLPFSCNTPILQLNITRYLSLTMQSHPNTEHSNPAHGVNSPLAWMADHLT